jgi:hypothetical protein
LLNLLFSPLDNLQLPFNVFIAHSLRVFIFSRLLVRVTRVWLEVLRLSAREENVVVISIGSLPFTGAYTSVISPGNIFVLNINKSIIFCVRSRNKYELGSLIASKYAL